MGSIEDRYAPVEEEEQYGCLKRSINCGPGFIEKYDQSVNQRERDQVRCGNARGRNNSFS